MVGNLIGDDNFCGIADVGEISMIDPGVRQAELARGGATEPIHSCVCRTYCQTPCWERFSSHKYHGSLADAEDSKFIYNDFRRSDWQLYRIARGSIYVPPCDVPDRAFALDRP